MTDTPTKPEIKKRSFWRKRRFLYCLKITVIVVCIADWYCEAHGLPAKLHHYIETLLKRKTLTFKADKIQLGIFNGIVFTNPQLEDPELAPEPILIASQIRFPLYSSLLPLSTIIVENGTLHIPLFPEFGEEGYNDVLRIQNLNAQVEIEHTDLKVSYMSANMDNINLNGSGIFNNIMSRVYEGLLRRFRAKKEDAVPLLNNQSLAELIQGIDIEVRRSLALSLIKLNKKNFPTPLDVTVHMSHFDLQMSQNHDVTISGKTQSFSYENIAVENASAKLRILGDKINLEQVSIELADDNNLAGSGELDSKSKNITGTLTGTMRPSLINRITERHFIGDLQDHLNIGVEPVPFSVDLNKYSFVTGLYDIDVKTLLAKVEIHNNTLSDVETTINLTNKKVLCRQLKGNLGADGHISANFEYTPGKLSAELEGAIKFDSLHSIIKKFPISTQLDSYKLKSTETLTFASSLLIDPNKNIFESNINIKLPQLLINTVKIKNIDTSLSYDGENVTSKGLKLELENGTKIKSRLSYNPEQETIVSSLTSKGSPVPLLDLLPQTEKLAVEEQMKLIDWPEDSDLVDLTIDSYYDWSETAQFSMYGDLVINNFSLKNNPFSYAAATFMVNYKKSIWNTLLPVIMLERPEGQAMMALSYTRKQPAPSHNNSNIPDSTKAKQKFIFKIESSLTGNVVLDMFVKGWNPDIINFPNSSNVKVLGKIDSENRKDDYAHIEILDSDYIWNELYMTHVSCNSFYRNGHLSFSNATGKISGGDITVDHESWLTNNNSKTKVSVKNANLTELLKQCKITLPTSEKQGNVSLNFNVNGTAKNDQQPDLYGTGSFQVTDSDLWAIPVLSSLQSLIDKSWTLNKFGKISSLDSTFSFEKDHIHANSIETDGSIISLSGSGDYYWPTKEYEFKVQAKVLKDALPFKLMTLALSPLSWFFEARLIGNGSENRWESTRTYKELFR